MHWNPRFTAFLVAVVAAVSVVACAPNNVTGDSISVPIASNALYFVDASGGRTVFNPGHRPGALNGVESVRALAGRTKPGDWMIVELGTNDVTNPISGMAARVQAVVDAVPAKVCLAFVTIWRTNPTYATRIDEWNRQVRSRVKQRACRAIIEWNIVARVYPGVVRPDGIHQSAAGRRWLTDEYRRVANLAPGAYASNRLERWLARSTFSIALVAFTAFLPAGVTGLCNPPALPPIRTFYAQVLNGYKDAFDRITPTTIRTVRVVTQTSSGGKLTKTDELWDCTLIDYWEDKTPAGDTPLYVKDRRWLLQPSAYNAACLKYGLGPAWARVPIEKQAFQPGSSTRYVLNNNSYVSNPHHLLQIITTLDASGRVLARYDNTYAMTFTEWSRSYLTGICWGCEMGKRQERGASWFVCAWLDLADGQWYCHNLDESELGLATEFDQVGNGTIGVAHDTPPEPLMTLQVQAAVTECKPVNTHQKCIDNIQRMLNERRP